MNRGVNENEINMKENKVEDDGEADGLTRESQQQKHDAIMATIMATIATMAEMTEMARATDTKKGLKETTGK